MERFVCIHGHFYQPPRENPWLEAVEEESSARPWHDWNERITEECYGPNATARILNDKGLITGIVNNYSRISFNVGPTLLSWMERKAPRTYQAILEADRQAQKRFGGHGSAIAQAYSHMIMPLASRRDKTTQVLWGLGDFSKRFGRDPEGMWLPETAVDTETLEVLAENGVRFTILAPRQAAGWRETGGTWRDAAGETIDTSTPCRCVLPSGREIALFFYNGAIARDIAFGDLLGDGTRFAKEILGAFPPDDGARRLVHVATDGESYGHHHSFGEMALAWCLHTIEQTPGAALTVYGEFLEQNPPQREVRIVENSSWSCAHGVERWRADCGCNTGANPSWKQQWRKPLRQAMDMVRDRLSPLYESESVDLLPDPWKARDAYIELVMDRSLEKTKAFLLKHCGRSLEPEERVKILRLLEMQRHCMLMYTSCGWFFDDVSGIETIQVLRYASRALQLAAELSGDSPESEFVDILAGAVCNRPGLANGAKVYERYVSPARIDLFRVAAHYAVFLLFERDLEQININRYEVKTEQLAITESTGARLAVGAAEFRSNTTTETRRLDFASCLTGDHHVACGLRESISEDAFNDMAGELEQSLREEKQRFPETALGPFFDRPLYTLSSLFKDEQSRVLREIIDDATEPFMAECGRLFVSSGEIMDFLSEVEMPVPKELHSAVELAMGEAVQRILKDPRTDMESLEEIAEDAARWNIKLDGPITLLAGDRIAQILKASLRDPSDDEPLDTAVRILALVKEMGARPEIRNCQDLALQIKKRVREEMHLPARTREKLALLLEALGVSPE
ncbi:MAG: DUF3536 domain-containing protein [Synergistota bacterium]|nr:DUF3536 domain-containing protein [Synergistota bacterium]